MRLPPGTPIPEVTVTAWIVFAQKGNAKAKAGDKKIDRFFYHKQFPHLAGTAYMIIYPVKVNNCFSESLFSCPNL